jgi:tRNA (guanine-N7-)-methyltransferase
MKNFIQEINPFRINSIDLENLVVEIGFGNGIYISNLAKLNPNKNFLGIEISGESVKKLSKIIKKEHLKNVYIIKMDAYWVFYLFLKDNKVLEIYINFPDPWPKKKHAHKRLTTIENLYLFTKKLKIGGFIQIKTDDLKFYNFTIENAKILNCFEIYTYENFKDIIQTKYEKKWIEQNKTIWTIKLIKKEEPQIQVRLKEIRRIFEMPKIKTDFIDFRMLENKIMKIDENLVVKFFKSFQRDDEWLIETLLSENDYVHYFFTSLRKKDGYYILSISNFSEVIITEGIKKFLEFLSNWKNL